MSKKNSTTGIIVVLAVATIGAMGMWWMTLEMLSSLQKDYKQLKEGNRILSETLKAETIKNEDLQRSLDKSDQEVATMEMWYIHKIEEDLDKPMSAFISDKGGRLKAHINLINERAAKKPPKTPAP